MAIITTHCKMGITDTSGNVNILYPQTTGNDVSITPNSIVTANNVQGLVDSLKASAFISNFTGIDDNATSSTTSTFSANKINSIVNNKLDAWTKVYENSYTGSAQPETIYTYSGNTHPSEIKLIFNINYIWGYSGEIVININDYIISKTGYVQGYQHFGDDADGYVYLGYDIGEKKVQVRYRCDSDDTRAGIGLKLYLRGTI